MDSWRLGTLKFGAWTTAYTNMAAKVDTQIATQAAKKLLSIRVSNFMAVLRGMDD